MRLQAVFNPTQLCLNLLVHSLHAQESEVFVGCFELAKYFGFFQNPSQCFRHAASVVVGVSAFGNVQVGHGDVKPDVREFTHRIADSLYTVLYTVRNFIRLKSLNLLYLIAFHCPLGGGRAIQLCHRGLIGEV